MGEGRVRRESVRKTRWCGWVGEGGEGGGGECENEEEEKVGHRRRGRVFGRGGVCICEAVLSPFPSPQCGRA